jgi:hypothetical protein
VRADFLDMNGVVLIDEDARLYEAMLGLATRALDKAGLAELLRTLPRS